MKEIKDIFRLALVFSLFLTVIISNNSFLLTWTLSPFLKTATSEEFARYKEVVSKRCGKTIIARSALDGGWVRASVEEFHPRLVDDGLLLKFRGKNFERRASIILEPDGTIRESGALLVKSEDNNGKIRVKEQPFPAGLFGFLFQETEEGYSSKDGCA